MVAVPSWCRDPLRTTRRVKEPPLLNCQKINRIWDIPRRHSTIGNMSPAKFEEVALAEAA